MCSTTCPIFSPESCGFTTTYGEDVVVLLLLDDEDEDEDVEEEELDLYSIRLLS